MKCPRCKEFYDQFKYVETVECKGLVLNNETVGMMSVIVGSNYIGKKFRLMVLEERGGNG